MFAPWDETKDSCLLRRQEFQSHPGDTGPCLGTSVVVTTGGALGIEDVGPGMPLRPTGSELAPHVHSAQGKTAF